tara:strand:- start:1881 stop:2030 length:150 start_codon:yes stop_codon:yes gene_type:complete
MYFKRPNGDVIEFNEKRHSIEDFKARYIKCNKYGEEVKEKKEKKAKKAK